MRTPRSPSRDRKSTRLNSSHVAISYAVFCLKKEIVMLRVVVVVDEQRIVSFLSRAVGGDVLGLASAYDGIRGLQLARSRSFLYGYGDHRLPRSVPARRPPG